MINISPLSELYTGENKIRYRHIYYLGKLKNYEKEILLDKSFIQSMEISNMKWLNKTEAINKLRNYHKSRYRIINDMFNFLENIEDYIII